MKGISDWNTEPYKKLQKFYNHWNFGASFYQSFYVLLAIIAVCAPLAVAAFTSELGDFRTRVLAFVGSVSIGLINAINFEEKAQYFRRASDHLNHGLISRQSGDFTTEQLNEAFKEAQQMIGAWKYIPPNKLD